LDLRNLRADVERLHQVREDSGSDMSALRNELNSAMNQIAERENDLADANQELSRLVSENTSLRAHLLDAKAMADEYAIRLSGTAAPDRFNVENQSESQHDVFDSEKLVLIPEKSDSAFVTACNMIQRIEIIIRRRKETNRELERIRATGANTSDEAIMLGAELEAMDANIASYREILFKSWEGLSELENRVKEEMMIYRETKMPVGNEGATPSNIRALEKSIAETSLMASSKLEDLQETLIRTRGGGHDIPVQFSIAFQTIPGQTVLVVGTWCDWNVQRGLRLTWNEGNLWRGSMMLHTGSNYEYKYVVAEEIVGGVPGDAPPYWPSWGRTEPELTSMFDGRAHMLTWQPGNNKAMALDNIHTDGVARIEVGDDWIANPKVSPITLFSSNDDVLEIVGSTALLGETVDRADHALLEARNQVQMMAEVASAALRMVDAELAEELSAQFDSIRLMGSLEAEAKGKHHRSADKDEPPESTGTWMNVGFGLDHAPRLEDDDAGEREDKNTEHDANGDWDIDIDIV